METQAARTSVFFFLPSSCRHSGEQGFPVTRVHTEFLCALVPKGKGADYDQGHSAPCKWAPWSEFRDEPTELLTAKIIFLGNSRCEEADGSRSARSPQSPPTQDASDLDSSCGFRNVVTVSPRFMRGLQLPPIAPQTEDAGLKHLLEEGDSFADFCG
eukprot:s2015_g5.t1